MATRTPVEQPVDAAFVRSFVVRWQEAWNAHDAERAVSLCTEDVVLSDPVLAEPARGRAAVREYLEATWRTFPDLAVETPEPELVDAETRRAALPWRITGTMLGSIDPPGWAPTGRHVETRGVDLYEFRGSLLARVDTYYDVVDWIRQLGLAPPRGSRAEKVMAFVQRNRMRLKRDVRGMVAHGR